MTDEPATIREADHGDEDLGTFVAVVNATTPEEPNSIENLRWEDTTDPGSVRFLAELDGLPVGAASVARIYMYPADFDGLWAHVNVVDFARRLGIGGRLLEAVGLAGALKRATIGWAIANGIEALETGNDVDNAAMRAVNARLGYTPIADRLVLRGPLSGGIMDR